jgi:hypothetical protein
MIIILPGQMIPNKPLDIHAVRWYNVHMTTTKESK